MARKSSPTRLKVSVALDAPLTQFLACQQDEAKKIHACIQQLISNITTSHRLQLSLIASLRLMLNTSAFDGSQACTASAMLTRRSPSTFQHGILSCLDFLSQGNHSWASWSCAADVWERREQDCRLSLSHYLHTQQSRNYFYQLHYVFDRRAKHE